MTTTTTPVRDTLADQFASIRKALGAGVAAGFAAATPLVIGAVQLESDGGATITGGEIGGVVGGFFAALATVGYVTWQTANKAKPTDQQAAVDAVEAQLVADTPDNATLVGETDQTPPPEGYKPRH